MRLPMLLAAALCWAAPSVASSVAQQPLAFATEHGRCVRTERIAVLHEHLAQVDPDRRAEACAGLIAELPLGAGLSAGLPLAGIARVTRELQGTPWTPLQSFVDSLDLSLTPGAFEARAEGRGEPITVRVHGLWSATETPDFTLTLTWVAPGGDRIVARREPIEGAAIHRTGFEMFVRPPVSGPGTWRLEPCVERDGQDACGVPVAVDCVADLADRFGAAVLAKPASDDRAYPLVRALDRLVRYGARGAVALGPGDLLRLLEEPSTPGLPRPQLLGAGSWVWAVLPSGEPLQAVCLLTSGRETVDAVFAGELGERWSAFANEHHAVLFSTSLPRRSADGNARDLLERISAEASALAGREVPFTVIARADTAGRLQLALHGGDDYPFDALVISAVLGSAKPEAIFPDVPRLLLSPGAVADEAAQLFAAPGADLALFNDLELPDLVGAWLTR